MKKIIVIVMTLCMVFGMSSVSVWAADATWQSETTIPRARATGIAATVGEKIYLIGGKDGSGKVSAVDIYDTVSKTWLTGTNIPETIESCSAAVVGKNIYVLGGYNGIYEQSVQIYNTETNTWSSGTDMPTGRSALATAVIGNNIYAIGGHLSTGDLKTVEIYNTETNTWSTGTSMPVARSYFSAHSVGDKIYAIAGDYKQILIYDSANSTWSISPVTTSISRSYCSTAYVNGNIYVFGGTVAPNYTNTTEVFNISDNSLKNGPTLITARDLSESSVVNGKIYLFGGRSLAGYDTRVETLQVPEQIIIPTAPTSLTATGGNSVVDLSWEAVTGATSYTVKRSTTVGGPYTVIFENVTGTTYSDTNVTNGSTYYYVVTAVNTAGSSENSNEVSATPQASVTVPEAPQTLTAIGGNSIVNLSWGSAPNSTSYTVKRSTTAGGPYTIIAENVTNTTYSDTSVTNGTTYYYVVAAVNTAGTSTNSNEASATPQAPASAGKALLVITMTNGLEKEYDLSMTDINAFINWYDGKAAGSGSGYYTFNKTFNLGPFLTRVDYITFDKIQNFEVMQYQ